MKPLLLLFAKTIASRALHARLGRRYPGSLRALGLLGWVLSPKKAVYGLALSKLFDIAGRLGKTKVRR